MSDAVSTWLRAAADPEVTGALERLYAETAREVEARGPVCWASGRCCNFERAGHRLYATGLETAFTLTRLPGLIAPPARLPIFPSPPAARPLTHDALADAIARGGCPFQAANLCSIHAARPLGCRVYFCDRAAQVWQRELYERVMAQLREIHNVHEVEYLYAEWRAVLGMFLEGAGASG